MASVFKRDGDKGKKGVKWIASWFDAERGVWKQTTAYTDRGQSFAMAQRLEQESAAKREGFNCNVRDESLKPMEDQLREYITHVVSNGSDPTYVSQLERRIRRVLTAIKAGRWIDIDAGRYQAVMLEMRSIRGFEKTGGLLSVTTRNEYLNSMKGFTKWAKDRRKIEHDPLVCLSQTDEKDSDKVHPRRALSVDQIVQLLDAALRRPETEVLTLRTGKKKGQLGAKVRPKILARARQTGIDRRMAYLLAIWTGLRRSELGQLEWRDLMLDATTPYIQLRAEITKAKRADVLPLHPQAVEELLAYRAHRPAVAGRVLPGMPTMKVLKADLACAGIEYGDRELGFADLHAQRTTLNMMLAGQGIDSRVRQAQLRHTDPRLTEDTYFDRSLFVKPQAEALGRAAAIPTTSPLAEPGPPVAREEAAGPVGGAEQPPSFSQLAHNGGGPTGLFGSRPVTDDRREGDGLGAERDSGNTQNQADFGTKRHDPASCDAGSNRKRVMRVELTTFTLAT